MNAAPSWLIVGVRPRANRFHDAFRREPHVKSHRFRTHTEVKGWEKLMSVNRKRFRIEQALLGDAPIVMPAEGGEIGPMHREIMAVLGANRVQMGGFGYVGDGWTVTKEIDRE